MPVAIPVHMLTTLARGSRPLTARPHCLHVQLLIGDAQQKPDGEFGVDGRD
jgi:hypothetical protein